MEEIHDQILDQIDELNDEKATALNDDTAHAYVDAAIDALNDALDCLRKAIRIEEGEARKRAAAYDDILLQHKGGLPRWPS